MSDDDNIVYGDLRCQKCGQPVYSSAHTCVSIDGHAYKKYWEYIRALRATTPTEPTT